MRNKLFMHTVQHDNILGSLKFVSKTDDYQSYGALIPAEMINLKMRNSPAYKTFLAYATGAIPPEKARKFKKPTSPLKKKTLSIDTSEGTGSKLRVPDVSKTDSSESEYKSWGDNNDDNDDDDQQSDDEPTMSNNPRTNDEEYDRINEEMYGDVNMELKDTMLEGEQKDDEEMTHAGHVDAEH
ncbi:hypothetical protein Tco_1308536 [Tanacetum coccineum]